MTMDTRTYRCRDCGYVLNTEEPLNKCPQCGSLYLIPKELWEIKQPKRLKLTFIHRLMLLVLGSFLSLVTVFILSTYTSLMLSFSFGFSILGSLKLALIMSIFIGIYGFFMGDEKLVKLFGLLWGTAEQPFSDDDSDVDNIVAAAINEIPPYIVYTILGCSIPLIYGYIIVEIIYS